MSMVKVQDCDIAAEFLRAKAQLKQKKIEGYKLTDKYTDNGK